MTRKKISFESLLSDKIITEPTEKSTDISAAMSSIANSMNPYLKEYPLDSEQQEIFEKIEKTKTNIFIHGEAGSGKSSFIQYLKNHSSKRIRLACPTAIAALNIGATTLHSLFQLPLSDFIILNELNKTKRYKLSSILSKTDILVIDEISMVRPDILDAVDYLCRVARHNNLQSFGGLQLVLVGDLCQLPPVIKSNAYEIFEKEYGNRLTYFFDSKAYVNGHFEKYELKKIYRQSDKTLLKNLSNIRRGKDLKSSIKYFNDSKFENSDEIKTAITITPYRQTAERINEKNLNKINEQEVIYEAKLKGSFETAKDFPSPKTLCLKKGALVIFNKNNANEWINGTSGIVEDLSENAIKVRLLSGGRVVYVKREEWKSFSYDYDILSGEITERETGVFTQFPLQLGYALTIHKAQGKTLDKVIIDLSGGAFDHGQAYVALSRTHTKSDIHLIRDLKESDIILDSRVLEFLQK